MEQHFSQTQGVAMGTSSAPSYENLYLSGWERQVFSEKAFVPYFNYVLSWYRFINDLLLVWTGPEKLLIEFIQQLNINNLNLHFTYSYDDKHKHISPFWI